METLNKIIDPFFQADDMQIQIYYITREYNKFNKDYEYDSFYCHIHKDFALSLIKEYTDKIKNLKDKPIVPYDVIASEDESLEKIEAQNITHIKSIKYLLNDDHSKVASDIKIDIEKIWGYAIVFKNSNKDKLTLFRKYSISKYFNENKNINFIEGTIEEIKEEIFSLDMKFDSVLYKNNIYIFNKYYFELFFSFKKEYVEYVNKSLDSLKKENVFENFDEFAERCLDSGNLLKKLAYVIKNNKLKCLKDNIQSADKIIKEYKLKVDFDKESKKIIYSKKTCSILDVMKLVCGCCVEDAVDKHKYFATSVKEVS